MLLSILLRTTCLALAGYVLWRLWLLAARRGRLIATIVAGGFVARSFGGQLLFWVSYLKLPFARSMQLGDGLWFFGLDALYYYVVAKRFALLGLDAVVHIPPNAPSITYVQALGVFLWMFGFETSTAILFNIFAYAATVALIISLAERRGVDRRITALVLATISFLPSIVLWALQPLKDAFVLLLSVGFAYAVDVMVSAWRDERGRRRVVRVLAAVLALMATTYVLGGIRWYYALILIAAASIPMLSVILSAPRAPAGLLRAVMLLALGFLLVQNVVAGAGPYLPEKMRMALRPWETGQSVRLDVMDDVVNDSRENLDRYTNGATRIRTGAALAETEKPAAPHEPPAATQKSTTAVQQPMTSAQNTTPEPQQPAAATQEPATAPLQPAATATQEPATAPQQPATAPQQPATATQEPTTAPAIAPQEPATAAEPAPPPQQPTAVPQQPPTTPQQSATTTQQPTTAPPQQPSTAEQQPTTAEQQPTAAPQDTVTATQEPTTPPPHAPVPRTFAGRMLTGLSALLLPRALASALGLVSIEGGRGLMWFADFDSILFNLVLIACVVMFFSGMRRGAWRDPLVWYLVAATVVLTLALAYTVSNYGTLFRHRQMVVGTLALIAIAVARPRAAEQSA